MREFVREYGLAGRVLLWSAAGMAALAIGAIFVFMRLDFNGDSPFYLLLAREQIGSGSLFPPGMCYSTEIFVLSPNLLMIPFMLILDDWMLIRSCGIALLYVLFVLAIVKSWNVAGDKHVGAALMCVIMLSVTPFSSDVVDKLFQQGAYLTYGVFIAIALGLSHVAVTQAEAFDESEGVICRREATLYAGAFLVVALPNLGGLRGILLIDVPVALALIVTRVVLCGSLDEALRSRTLRRLLAVMALGILTAFMGHRVLSTLYWSEGGQMSLSVDSSSALTSNVLEYFNVMFYLYGQGFSMPMLSAGGVVKLMTYLYTSLVAVLLPIVGLVRFKKIDSAFRRFVIAFRWVSALILFAVSVSTGAVNIASRYLIPTYFTNAFASAAVLEEILSHRTRLEAGLFATLLCGYCLMTSSYYWHRSLPLLSEDTTHQGIVAFLENHNLDYGYATFFNSYTNMCFSNGDIQFVSFAYSAKDAPVDPTHVMRWLTNESWYDPQFHPGRCFILLRGDEQIEEVWYDLAEERLLFEDYTVLIFDRNINLYGT